MRRNERGTFCNILTPISAFVILVKFRTLRTNLPLQGNKLGISTSSHKRVLRLRSTGRVYNFGAGTAVYRTAVPHESVRCMAASDIRISTSSSGSSIWIFLRPQIYRILENFFDFSKVPDRFSTSWNSELLFRRQPYTIMAT